jgi:hypothetical protein
MIKRKKRKKRTRKLSVTDAMLLARLVKKYGREMIAAATRQVPLPRGRGRPSVPYRVLERAWLADWIDRWAERHRLAGSRKPLYDAATDLYDECYEGVGREDRPDTTKFVDAILRQALRGRRDLQQLRERVGKPLTGLDDFIKYLNF